MDISKMARALNEFVDEVLPDQAPSTCKRCSTERDCRDVLGNGTLICVECATPREKDAFFRRLAGVDPVS